MKRCNNCNLEKSDDLFVKDKKSKDGTRNMCIECNKIRLKIYRDNNKGKISDRNKKWNTDNKNYFVKYREEKSDILEEYNKEYRMINKDILLEKNKEYKKTEEYKLKHKEYQRKYREKNKEIINLNQKEYQKKFSDNNKEKNKERLKNYFRERKKNDPLFKLKCSLRTTLWISLNKLGYKKDSNTEKILGCSYYELLTHIESQFESWMNWDNHGLYEINMYNIGWDIDHIKPLNMVTTPEEVINLFHYTNLRPLCSKINRDIKKGNY